VERNAQVDVLAQLLGQEQARTIFALATLAESVVGLHQQVQQLQQQIDAAQAAPVFDAAAVYAPDEDAEAT
jgi:hypothetical protein